MSKGESGFSKNRRNKGLIFGGAVALLAALGAIGYKAGEVTNDAPQSTVVEAEQGLTAAKQQFAAAAKDGSCEYGVLSGMLTTRAHLGEQAVRVALDGACGSSQLHSEQAAEAQRSLVKVQTAQSAVGEAKDAANYDAFEMSAYIVFGALAQVVGLGVVAGTCMSLGNDKSRVYGTL